MASTTAAVVGPFDEPVWQQDSKCKRHMAYSRQPIVGEVKGDTELAFALENALTAKVLNDQEAQLSLLKRIGVALLKDHINMLFGAERKPAISKELTVDRVIAKGFIVHEVVTNPSQRSIGPAEIVVENPAQRDIPSFGASARSIS